MEHWYVYYAMKDEDRSAALPRVRAMQESLIAATGVRARIEERIDSHRAPTWMEVYERVGDADGFRRMLEAALAASGLPGALREARHIERFKVL